MNDECKNHFNVNVLNISKEFASTAYPCNAHASNKGTQLVQYNTELGHKNALNNLYLLGW